MLRRQNTGDRRQNTGDRRQRSEVGSRRPETTLNTERRIWNTVDVRLLGGNSAVSFKVSATATKSLLRITERALKRSTVVILEKSGIQNNILFQNVIWSGFAAKLNRLRCRLLMADGLDWIPLRLRSGW